MLNDLIPFAECCLAVSMMTYLWARGKCRVYSKHSEPALAVAPSSLCLKINIDHGELNTLILPANSSHDNTFW